MKKLLLIGIVFLILISSVTAFEWNNVTCSSTPSDYQYYNASGHTATSAGDSTFFDNTTSDYVIRVEEFTRSDDTDQHGAGVYHPSSVVETFHWDLLTPPGDGTSFGIWNDASWFDTDVVTSVGTNYNLTVVFQQNNFIKNTTIENGVTTLTFQNLGWRVDLPANEWRVADLDTGTASWSGMYVWNCTTTFCDCPAAPAAPTIVVNYPIDNDHQAVLLTANVTPSDTDDSFLNLTLYVNNTINATSLNVAQGTSTTISAVGMPNGNYTWLVQVCDDSLSCVNSTARTYIYDDISPTITFTNPSGNTVSTSITLDIDLADDYLYNYYVNLTNPSDVEQWSENETNLSALQTYKIANTLDLTGNTSGTYNVFVRVCDGHTAQNIEDMEVDSYQQSLVFNGMVIYTPDGFGTTYQKLNDRYAFTFYTQNAQEEIEFTMPSSCEYQPYSKYFGHYICHDKYWIDFEGDYEEVEVTENKIKIKSSYPRTVWNFNSLGELNCLKQSQSFTIDLTAPTVTLQKPANSTVLKRSLDQFGFNVNEMSNCSFYLETDGNFSGATANFTILNTNGDYVKQLTGFQENTNYSWMVSCTDGIGNQGNSTAWDFTYSRIRFTFERFECDASTTPKSILFSVIIIIMVAIWMFAIIIRIPLLNLFVAFVMAYFSWNVAACFQFANVLFVVMAIVSFLFAIYGASTNGKASAFR